MGGSGSGGSISFGKPPEPSGADECSTISFKAVLHSPQPDVIQTLVVGTILQLVAIDNKPPVMAVTKDGKPVGGVIQNSHQLIRCMTNGSQFIAEVITIDKGAVTVHVHTE